jgi:hypothetical protein
MQRRGSITAGALALCWLAHPAAADLVIQEIVDGTVNSQPKWVELVNTGSECLFLGDFELCYYANGSATPSSCSDLGDVFLAAGASYVFAYEPATNTACSPTMTCFQVIYGFAPNQHGGASINGNDAVSLRDDLTQSVIDVYGVIGVDGTGQVWEYTDGYSTRQSTSATATFQPNDWLFGGPNSLEDPGGDPVETILIQTLTSPGGYASCTPPVVSYCTPGTSASGCQALLSASGVPSAAAGSGFVVSAPNAEGSKKGVFYFGVNGRQALPWGTGSSFSCVVPPVVRTDILASGGSVGQCNGTFSVDLNALWCSSCPMPGVNPGVGTVVQTQLWYRDPLNPSGTTTSLSDALEFTLTP